MLIGTYSGKGAEYFEPDSAQMIPVDREEVRERFLRGEIDVLVCTDAAAEGLNLQTADWLVNYDLGWNPMKVEQRIGRIDRIGQKHKDIYVLNLCYADSAEWIVYGRLLSRLAEANMIVGTQQISLLPIEPEDFRQLAEGTLTPEELEVHARERIELQRKRTESMEINPQELYEIYMRMTRADDRYRAPVNMSAIWEVLSGSKYLRSLGCVASQDPDKPVLKISGIDCIPDGTVLTVSRELYEEGLADSGVRIHFASYGDPFFEAILRHLEGFHLPKCIRRIVIRVPGMDNVEVIGYSVACRGAGSMHEIRLIRSWSDLKDLHLLEEETLREGEVEPVRKELERMAREEFAPYLAADRVERDNIRAAKAQEMLNFLVIRDLLDVKAKSAGERPLFWPVLREVDSLCDDREKILVTGLPVDVLKMLSADLLFKCRLPSVGSTASLLVPRIFVRAARDAASRLADSMKVRKSELYVDTVLARLQREIETRLRQIH
jgi:hypothetical protein